MCPDLKLIGVGNPFRSDDGVGHSVISSLLERLDPGLLDKSDGNVAALYDSLSSYREVVLIDAVDSPGAAGTVIEIDPANGALSGQGLRASTHAMGIAEAIALARTLGTLPERLRLIGIVGRDFSHGEGLCEPVSSAAHALAMALAEEYADA